MPGFECVLIVKESTKKFGQMFARNLQSKENNLTQNFINTFSIYIFCA